MGQIKGVSVLNIYKYIKTLAGEKGLEKVGTALEPNDQRIFRSPMVPITWVEYGYYVRLLLTMDRVLGKGDMNLLKESSLWCAREDFRGIYKFFISFTSPQFIVKNAPKIWRQYFDAGKMVVEKLGEKNATITLTDFPDMPRYHDVEQTPFFEECFRLAGGKNPRGTHPQCLARGDDKCIFQFVWD